MSTLPVPVLVLLTAGPLAAATSVLFEQAGAINNGWYSDASLQYPQALGDRFQTTGIWSVVHTLQSSDPFTSFSKDFTLANYNHSFLHL